MGSNFDKRWAQAEEKVLEIVANDDKWKLFAQQVGQHGVDLSGFKNARERAKNDEGFRSYLKSIYLSYSAIQICDSCDYNPNCRTGEKKYSARRRFDCDWRKTEGDVLAGYTSSIHSNNATRINDIIDELTAKLRDSHSDEKALEEIKASSQGMMGILYKFLDEYDSGMYGAHELSQRVGVISSCFKQTPFALYLNNNPKWRKAYEELDKVVLGVHTNRTKAPLWLDAEKNLCPHQYFDLSSPH